MQVLFQFYGMPLPIQETFSYTFQLSIMFWCSLNFTSCQGNWCRVLSDPLLRFGLCVLTVALHTELGKTLAISNILRTWNIFHCKSVSCTLRSHPLILAQVLDLGEKTSVIKCIQQACGQSLVHTQHHTNRHAIFRRPTQSPRPLSPSENICVLYRQAPVA